MAAITQISIDLTKLDKSKIIKGKNGAEYYNLQVSINNETDQYGKSVQVSEPQTKEERAEKKPRIFYGNGKVLWTDGKINLSEKKVDTSF